MVSFVCARLRAPLRPLSTEGAGSHPRAFPRPRPSSSSFDGFASRETRRRRRRTRARRHRHRHRRPRSRRRSLARRSSPIARETRIHRDRRRETLASGTTSATDRTRARPSRARRERVIERNKTFRASRRANTHPHGCLHDAARPRKAGSIAPSREADRSGGCVVFVCLSSDSWVTYFDSCKVMKRTCESSRVVMGRRGDLKKPMCV